MKLISVYQLNYCQEKQYLRNFNCYFINKCEVKLKVNLVIFCYHYNLDLKNFKMLPYLCISLLASKYCIPSHIWYAKSHKVSTGKLDLNDGSLRHSSRDLKGASSVTNIKLPSTFGKTTPKNLTIFGWSMLCIIEASFKNSTILLCILSRDRHFIAT